MKDFGVEFDFSHDLPFCSCGAGLGREEEEDSVNLLSEATRNLIGCSRNKSQTLTLDLRKLLAIVRCLIPNEQSTTSTLRYLSMLI
jgi:hypothetical protein